MRRPERLAEVLREEIMEIVGYELDDPRLLGVTVTDVIVNENMRDAKVFVIVEGGDAEVRAAMKALNNAAPFVKQQVALNLNVRYAPVLHFVRDTAEENAARVEKLLGEIHQGEKSEKEEMENG